MTPEGHRPAPPRTGSAAAFRGLMEEAMAGTDRFGHREHVHLTWLAVHRYGTAAAIALVSTGIRRTTWYAGMPQKYNATMSRAWVELVGHRVDTGTGDGDFAAFLRRNPDLLDKRILTRHYRASTLAGAQARTGWVEPDLAPFPWTAPPP